MNRQKILDNVAKTSKTRPRNVVGVFLAVIGGVMAAVGPAAFFASLSEDVSPQNKIGAGALVAGAIGIGLFWLGYRMILSRRKITREDVAAAIDIAGYITVFEHGKAAISVSPADITVSPNGIRLRPESGIIELSWPEIRKAEWRSVYGRDAYQIITSKYEVVVGSTDPLQARTEHRALWFFNFFVSDAGRAGSVAVAVDNSNDVRLLNALHAYTRAYAPSAASPWSHYLERWLFMLSLRLVPFVVAVVWAMGIVEGMDTGFGFTVPGIIAIVVGFVIVMLSFNEELKFSQKVTGKKALI